MNTRTMFSKKKYIERMGKEVYLENKVWVDRCDGKTVKDGKCGLYAIDYRWCKRMEGECKK